jgi:hypothetical protein
LEARATATWNACSLGVVGGPKGLKDRKCFTTRKPRLVSLFSDCFVQRFSTLQPERLEAPTFDGVLDLAGWNCVLCDCPCTFPLPRILGYASSCPLVAGLVALALPRLEKVVVHGDGVCTVGRSSGKLVSLMGVLRPGTGKLQSGSAGLDLRKATCGPVPTHHKPYKVAGPRLSRRIYPPRANQMTSAIATMARMMATNARALHAGPRPTPE